MLHRIGGHTPARFGGLSIFDRSQCVVRASLRSSTQRIAARLVASQLNATTTGSKVREQSLADRWTEAEASVYGSSLKLFACILPVVRACATFGATAEEIANYLDIPWGSFKRWIYAEFELREALKRGREASDERVVESLYQQALAGNVGAICFWLKNRRPSEWRDVQNIHKPTSVTTSSAIAR